MRKILTKLITTLTLIILACFCCFSVLGCKGKEETPKTYSHEQIFAEFGKYAVTVQSGDSEGTGIILKASNGEAIMATCYHVSGYDASTLKVNLGDENFKDCVAETIGYDKRFDLAFFRLTSVNFSTEIDFLSGKNVLSDDKIAPIGKEVTVIGNAFGDGISAFDGIVSLPETVELVEGYYKPLVRVTAPVNGGCSGAPVFDSDGNLIGMGQGIRANGEGASYVLPASIMITLANRAVQNPKNAEIERERISFDKQDDRLFADAVIALITVNDKTYYYSKNSLTLNGAKVTLTVGEKQAPNTLAGVTNAFLTLYWMQN